MLFLVMGFISLVDEIQFMLISSLHICMRSIYRVLIQCSRAKDIQYVFKGGGGISCQSRVLNIIDVKFSIPGLGYQLLELTRKTNGTQERFEYAQL